MRVCQELMPGYGEERILNGLPVEVRQFLAAAIEEEPWFLHEYVIPTLQGLDGHDKIIDDLSNAMAELEIEEEIFGVDPDDYEFIGDPNLGYLGKSLKKRVKKVVKKVVAPIKAVHKKIEDKIVPKKLVEITKKIADAPKRVHEKAKEKIHETAKRGGKILHRAAKSGKLQIALAPFTAGVSLAFHPKVGAAAKKFMAGPYGNVVVGALGALFAIPTGGASVAAAAALTTANTMYQKKKAAEEAKKAAKANAGELQAEADQLQSQAEQELNDFYNQNEAFLTERGLTRAIWNAASFDEKVALLDAAVSGRIQAPAPTPSAGTSPSPGSTGTPIQPGDFSATMPSGGGGSGYAPSGGGGGGGGGSSYDPYAPGATQQPGGVAKASMGELLMPAMVGVGLLAVFMQSKKKGRKTRRNPGRRRMRHSA